jgi:hypothetical protein
MIMKQILKVAFGLSGIFSTFCAYGEETYSGVEAFSDWDKLKVPGAKCGDGQPYQAYVKKNNPQKWIVELQGGGACWNRSTCWGPTPLTFIHPIPSALLAKYLIKKNQTKLDLSDHSYLYLPYCTGDVHVGTHTTRYGGLPVHHVGHTNVEQSLDYLEQKGMVEWNKVENAVLLGSSAGAIGALFHIESLEKRLPPNSQKSLIADAPGLHFGDRFWDRWSVELMKDFQNGFQSIGLDFQESNGMVASQMKHYCSRYSSWRIAFLQGTKDIVMSALFGTVAPDEHEKLVLGSGGILKTTEDPSDTCRSWVKKTYQHTFLESVLSDFLRKLRDLQLAESSLGKFVSETIKKGVGENEVLLQ